MFTHLSNKEITALGHLIAEEIYCKCPEEAHVYEALAKQVYVSLEQLFRDDYHKCNKPCKCRR